MRLTLKEARKLVPKPKNVWELQKRDFDTADIIQAIHEHDRDYASDTEELARHFSLTEQGLYDLWCFVRSEIRYTADPFDKEMVKSPSQTIHDGFADCKSMTLLINSVIYNLGGRPDFKYVAFWDEYGLEDENVTHVYSTVKLPGRRKKFILDAVYHVFDGESPYSWHLIKPGHYKKNQVAIAGIHGRNASDYVGPILMFFTAVGIIKSISK